MTASQTRQAAERVRSAEADYALAARERFEVPFGALTVDLDRVAELAVTIRQTAQTLAALYADLEFAAPNGKRDDTDLLAGLIADAMETHCSGEANSLISAHLLALAGKTSFFPVAREVVGVAA